MCIYTYISIILLLIVILEVTKIMPHKVALWLSALLVIFIAVFRDTSVGGDTQNYWLFFSNISNTYYGSASHPTDGMEPGFVALGRLFTTLSNNGYFWIGLTALLNFIPYYILVRKNSYITSIPFFIVMNVWGLFSIEITALRQVYAVSFAICAYLVYCSDLKKRKKIFATGLLLIMSLITHNSMLIVLPILIACLFLRISTRTGLLIMIASLVIVLVVPTIFSSIFQEFYMQMRFVNAASRMTDYYDNSNYDLDYEISFNRLGPQTLLGCLLLWLARKEDSEFRFSLNCLVLGVAMYNIGAAFPMMSRTTFALTLIGSTLITKDILQKKNRIALLTLLLLLGFFLRTSIKAFNNYEETGGHLIPYTFIWEK